MQRAEGEMVTIERLLGPNWKRRLILWGGTFAAVMAFIGVTVFAVVIWSMNSSWAYSEGTRLARSNVRVARELGEPIEFGWFVTGQINVTGDSGTADIAIPVRGHNNKGKVYIVAHKVHGEWKVDEAVARLNDADKVIDLLSNSTAMK
jgi:hypothetical protein